MLARPFRWFKRLRLPSKIWIIVGVAHALSILLTAIIMFSLTFTNQSPMGDKQRVRCYAVIFFLTVFFHLYYLFEGIYKENILELLAFMITGLVTLGFAIYRMAVSTWRKTADIYILLGVSGLGSLTYFILSCWVFREFGWFVYKTITADAKLQRIYWNLSFFQTFLKMDYYLHAICATLAMFFFKIDYQYGLVIAGIVLLLGWVFWGHFATLKENYPATIFFLLASLITPPYLIYKVIRMYSGSKHMANMPKEQTVAFVSLTLLCVLCVWITCIRAMYFYRRGLKEVLQLRAQKARVAPTSSGSINSDPSPALTPSSSASSASSLSSPLLENSEEGLGPDPMLIPASSTSSSFRSKRTKKKKTFLAAAKTAQSPAAAGEIV